MRSLKTKYSPNYKRNKHPFVIRLIALWRIITCRNFILIDFKETEIGRNVRPLYRTDYNSESEMLTLKAAILKKTKDI